MPTEAEYADMLAAMIKQKEWLERAIEAIKPLAGSGSISADKVSAPADTAPLWPSPNKPDKMNVSIFENMTMPQAVLHVLDKAPDRELSASSIRDSLLKGGFHTQSDDTKVYAAVFTTLRRLAERGQVTKCKDTGKWKANLFERNGSDSFLGGGG